MTNTFRSTVLILPGLGNSGDAHWQTLWEKQFGFIRVQQREWDKPVCSDWIDTIDGKISELNPAAVILVGHSLACCTVAFWVKRFNRKIKGALLVAPSDTEADSYPPGTTGFKPMPMNAIPFPTITITSSDDFYVRLDRAQQFAKAWNSELINIGPAGHINASSNLGSWPEGLEYLKKLDGI
jgi:predicted alpha/beta hydrolase family esterase